MASKTKYIFFYVFVAILLCGCLNNDIPYPTIEAKFISMRAEGEISTAVIDEENQSISLNLSETVDLEKVKILSYEITEGASLSEEITNGLNLTKAFGVTLSLYQNYYWTITANQEIKRYFTVEGQVGESVIDVSGKRAVVYISKNIPLSAVKITSLKLGPSEISKMFPDISNQIVDFSKGPVKVEVSYLQKTENWTIYAVTSDIAVDITSVDAWTNVIWAYGSAEAGKNNGFEYKELSADVWTEVPAAWITDNGGTFSACIRHLKANTGYEVRAYSDDLRSTVSQVVTGGYYEIPNASFDEWRKDGKVWCPWQEGGVAFWGTGNKGATTLGDSNTYPSTDTWNGAEGYSARLDTKFVGIAGVGKLAAGNMFSGDYKKTDGTNGILDFGRPCKERPTRLKGYWKYTCVPISHSSSEYSHLKGQPDTANVYIALTDWSAPFEIRTNPKNRQLLDKNADYIIAYGSIQSGENIPEWTPFTVELEYRDTHRVPSYILIVSSASKYGDFFTGGSGSTLMIDNYSLEWDYE